MAVKLLAKWPFETRGEWQSRPIYGRVTAALLIDFMCDVNSLHNTLRCGWRWLLRVTPHSERQPTRLIEDSEASCERAFSAFGIVSNKSATRLLVAAHSNVMFASNCTSLAERTCNGLCIILTPLECEIFCKWEHKFSFPAFLGPKLNFPANEWMQKCRRKSAGSSASR